MMLFGRIFKTTHKIGFSIVSPENLSACSLSDLCPGQIKSILNTQGRKNCKGNLIRWNEIGNQVLIFSKIIPNNFFINHVSSCDCFPFLLLSWRRDVLMFFVFFVGALLTYVKIAGIILINKVAHGGHGRDLWLTDI